MKVKKLGLFTRILCLYFAIYMAVPFSMWAQLIINPPTFPNSNTVQLTLSGTASTNAYILFSTPNLATNINSWTRLTTGTLGQATFSVTKTTNTTMFFRAGVAPITTPTVATPVFTPGGGTYSTPTNIVVTCATEGAAIYYTTDGSTPTSSSTYIYNGGSIYLSGITTLKAIAYAYGYTNSAVATATYNINSPPTVNAGSQQNISSSSTTLQGTVTDDGLTGGGLQFTNWTKISGPGTVTFGNSSQTNTTATFGANGIYVLQLAASDGQYTNSSQVTIAVNPTLSVSLTAPTGGSTYTVPTNILLQATATCSSGSVTNVLFYANSTLIGNATSSPYTFQWKSPSSGNLALTAVAQSTDPNNFSLASSPVNITVNWPTNVGQVTLAQADLEIPSAGLPIEVNREYDTRYGTNGSFGFNWKLDYETIKIQKSGSLATGWQGTKNGGLTYIISPTVQHLITVTLNDGSQYFFVAQLVFDIGGNPSIVESVTPDCYNFFTVHLVCTPLGQGQLSVAMPSSSVGMDDQLSGWTRSLTAVYFDDTGFPINNYEPDFSQFTFTAPDGTKYGFYSDGTVASETDRNGNSLSFSTSGISSSTGRQISFTRDGNNRITQISDPIAINTSGSPVLKYSYDSIGNLTNVAQLVQRSPAIYQNTGYAYTNTAFPHNLTAITDPRGLVSQRYTYDSQGRLFQQFDAYGRATTYSYDAVTHQQTIVDRNGYPTTQTFTAAGQLATVQDPNGGVTSYGYDEQGNKIAQTNAVGDTVSYSYDANGHLIGQTNALNQAASATYNQFGEVLVSIDNRGYGATNSYDANGNLLSTTNALGIVTTYGYDSKGDQTAVTNALGLPEEIIIQNQYNQYGDLTNTTTLNAQSQTLGQTSYTYDDNGNKKTETQKRTLPGGGNGAVLTQWSYDAANRVIQTIDGDSFTNYVVYNGINKQAETIDALGRTNFFFYDANGLLTNETFPDGTFESYGYDANGNRTNFVDRAGNPTAYTYDPVGRLFATTYADGSEVSTIYNLAGQVSSTVKYPINPPPPGPSLVDPQETFYGYDATGRRTSITDPLSQATQFTFDANGNQTSVIDALNHTNIYVYDALNRLIEHIYPDNTSDNYGYDAIGNRIAVTNQDNVVTRYGYDALKRLVAVTNAFGTSQQMVTHYVYDEVGNLLQQIDALNHTNSFAYDGMGRRIQETLPGNQGATFGYDAVGNMIRETNFNNVVITNQYDSLNRLTNTLSAGGYHVSFAYSPTGQRTNMVDASGTTSYTYDDRDQLKTKVTPEGTLTYSYDAFDNLYQITSSTSNGTQLTYLYDALNRVTNVTDRFANSAVYSYDAAGNLQTTVLSNGITNIYSYNSLNRLTNIVCNNYSGLTQARFAYQLMKGGARTNEVEMVNALNRSYALNYDPLYRLTNEIISGVSPTGTISYRYDAVGNRTNRTSTVSGVANQSFTYNANDQLNSDVYDSNGNTRTNGSNVYLYDVKNRLTNAVVGGTNIAFVYDGDGNRVEKIIGTTTNFYLIDDRNPSGYAQVLEELTTVGSTPARLYTYGLALISQRQSNGATSFYGFDGNGNTRFLTAANGTISDTYAFDAFGDLLSSTGSTPNAYLYTGQQYDPNIGFYYLRARYMNPATGRFLTRDTFQGSIFDPPSLHKYTYTANDPINHSDPSGKQFGFTLIGLLVTVSIVAVVVLGGIYAYRHLLYPVGQQLDSQPIGENDLNAAVAQLQRYRSVDPKFDLLISAIEDGRVQVKVFNGTGAGQHFELNTGTMYIAHETINNGPLATALVIFAEFQHDPVSGAILNEPDAQAEFVRVRNAIRQIDPNAITPYINGLQHGQNGF